MKCLAFLLMASLCWAAGCSKDEPESKSPPGKTGPVSGLNSPGGMGGDGGEDLVAGSENMPQPPAGGTQRVSEDPQAPPVLAEMDGRFYEVYEIAKIPFTGKVVLYHATGVEKLEKIYKDGQLTRLTEWHDNGQKSHEVTHAANGDITEKRWNKKGEEITAAANTSVGRGIEWTFGGGQSARRIDGYSGKPSDLIKRVFGAPNEEQNGVWIYKDMKVTAVQSGQTMTVVRFTIAGGQVLSVSVEP